MAGIESKNKEVAPKLMKIKVIIADDNSFIRESLKIILSTYRKLKCLTPSVIGQEAVDYCQKHEVDIALLDVRMPNMNGVEATKLITETTNTKPIILTTFDDDEYILDAIKNGARGYLLKNNDPEQIRDAMKSVFHGNSILQDVILEKIKSNLSASYKEPETKIDLTGFTEREREIMSLIAKGYSNKAISRNYLSLRGR